MERYHYSAVEGKENDFTHGLRKPYLEVHVRAGGGEVGNDAIRARNLPDDSFLWRNIPNWKAPNNLNDAKAGLCDGSSYRRLLPLKVLRERESKKAPGLGGIFAGHQSSIIVNTA